MILDYVFIDLFEWGMSGAVGVTTISHLGAAFIIYFYIMGKGVKVIPTLFKLKKDIVGETFKIGSVNLVRQGTISLIAILLIIQYTSMVVKLEA